MTTTKGSLGPAFPAQEMSRSDGMTLRAYAAIALRVPTSGLDWLDEMIRVAQRDELAEKVMQGLVARKFTVDERGRPFVEWVVEYSFEFADAMLRHQDA